MQRNDPAPVNKETRLLKSAGRHRCGAHNRLHGTNTSESNQSVWSTATTTIARKMPAGDSPGKDLDRRSTSGYDMPTNWWLHRWTQSTKHSPRGLLSPKLPMIYFRPKLIASGSSSARNTSGDRTVESPSLPSWVMIPYRSTGIRLSIHLVTRPTFGATTLVTARISKSSKFGTEIALSIPTWLRLFLLGPASIISDRNHKWHLASSEPIKDPHPRGCWFSARFLHNKWLPSRISVSECLTIFHADQCVFSS